jgi:hypothetical protein
LKVLRRGYKAGQRRCVLATQYEPKESAVECAGVRECQIKNYISVYFISTGLVERLRDSEKKIIPLWHAGSRLRFSFAHSRTACAVRMGK